MCLTVVDKQAQSDRVGQFAETLAKATNVFGDQHRAESWLFERTLSLDNQRPVDLLATPAGAKLVEDLLVRLDYGVYQ